MQQVLLGLLSPHWCDSADKPWFFAIEKQVVLLQFDSFVGPNEHQLKQTQMADTYLNSVPAVKLLRVEVLARRYCTGLGSEQYSAVQNAILLRIKTVPWRRTHQLGQSTSLPISCSSKIGLLGSQCLCSIYVHQFGPYMIIWLKYAEIVNHSPNSVVQCCP